MIKKEVLDYILLPFYCIDSTELVFKFKKLFSFLKRGGKLSTDPFSDAFLIGVWSNSSELIHNYIHNHYSGKAHDLNSKEEIVAESFILHISDNFENYNAAINDSNLDFTSNVPGVYYNISTMRPN